MMQTPEPMIQGHPAHAYSKTQTSAASLSENPGICRTFFRNPITSPSGSGICHLTCRTKLRISWLPKSRCNSPLKLHLKIAVAEVEDALCNYSDATALSNDVAQLVDMFCYLFDLNHAGLRLTTLDRAMCPRFHVDRVPCRLVTTYQGCSTQWLPHQLIDRTKLGTGSNGLPDEHSGLYPNAEDVQQLTAGDVALLKGELWNERENFGLVHRSPTPEPGEKRLLLTLDFLS